MKKIDVDKIQIHPSWKEVLRAEFEQPYFHAIKTTLLEAKQQQKVIYPPGPLIFNAFNKTTFENTRAVILGQDPYHNPNEAMGLCFSVPRDVKVPPSLKRIFKEMHEDIGFEIPDHGDISAWSEQGVLLLNAMLTVEKNSAGSHRKIGWQRFTDAVIREISLRKQHVVFFLWGNFAKSKASLIDEDKHLVLRSAHPSPLAGNAFFGNHHFSQANAYLSHHNKGAIDWRIA